MNTSLYLASVLLVVAGTLANAAESVPLTGNAFRKALDSTTDIVWKERALRDALDRLGEAKEIAIVLDRRVDPEQLISLSLSDVTLEQLLRQVASRQQLGIAIFDSTVYLGPEATTTRIGTAAAIQHDKGAASPRKARLQSVPALTTTELATPRDLLEAWAKSCGVQLYHADKLPHDLWPAQRYPAQTAASRAALILAGFNSAIEFSPDGTAARVVPMPEQPTLTRTYDGGGNPKQRADQISTQFPQAEVRVEGNKLAIAAGLEDHDYIARLLRGETVRRIQTTPGEKRYTLAVQNQPLAGVAKAIGAQAKIEVEFDPAIQDKRGELVTFEVKDVTLEELFKALVAPAGLTFQMSEGKIKIVPQN